MKKLTKAFEFFGAVMLGKVMASVNLVEAHIMAKRYWFLDLSFHHFAKWLLKCWDAFF